MQAQEQTHLMLNSLFFQLQKEGGPEKQALCRGRVVLSLLNLSRKCWQWTGLGLQIDQGQFFNKNPTATL